MTIERSNFNGNYHEATKFGNMLFLTGQIGEGDTIAEQTVSCLNNVKTALRKYGSDENSILYVTIYLPNPEDFSAFNAAWAAWFAEGTHPARTCISAEIVSPGLMVEMSVIAAVKD